MRCRNARLVLNNLPFLEACIPRPVPGALRHPWDRRRSSRSDLHGAAGDAPGPPMATIDIALDPFPHNAGTTTIEAMWQGVPVVSLAGRPSVGRFGASILHAVGLDDWVITTRGLRGTRGRRGVRSRGPRHVTRRTAPAYGSFAAPRCDRPRPVQSKQAYRMLWDEWREGDSARLRRLYTRGRLRPRPMLAPPDARTRSRQCRRSPRARSAGLSRQAIARSGSTTCRRPSTSAPASSRTACQPRCDPALAGSSRRCRSSRARRARTGTQSRVGALNNLGNILRDAGRYRRKR